MKRLQHIYSLRLWGETVIWLPDLVFPVLPVFKLTSLSPGGMVLLAAGGTLQGIIIAFLIVTFYSNKLEGMAVEKLQTCLQQFF